MTALTNFYGLNIDTPLSTHDGKAHQEWSQTTLGRLNAINPQIYLIKLADRSQLASYAWRVVDATALAPRSSLVRIATGRDAADTAFLSVVHGSFAMGDMLVSAASESTTLDEGPDELVQLG